MEHLDGRVIILILFVVISAVKWLIEKFNNQGGQPEESSEALEEIYDNFREEIRQRQTTPQQPQAAHSPPPIPQSPPVVQHVQQQAKPAQVTLPKKPKKRTLSSEEQAALARFQQNTPSKKRKRKQRPQASVLAMLSHPQSTQQAIILTEILGKPKSMQDA